MLLPSGNKQNNLLFRTPENKKIRKLFSPLTSFGKIHAVLNERKPKNKEKNPESRLHAAILPQRIRFFRAFLHFGSADPRGPNFAEIHARGRRGRLESDHRDLIPPWGHGLLHGEAKSRPWQSGMIGSKAKSIMAD